MTPKEILIAARDYLRDPSHWHKGGLNGPNNSVCMIRSMDLAKRPAFILTPQGLLDLEHPANIARYRADVYLGNAIGLKDGIGIGFWNDAPERTHADVMAAFERAIVLAEADELEVFPDLPSSADVEELTFGIHDHRSGIATGSRTASTDRRLFYGNQRSTVRQVDSDG